MSVSTEHSRLVRTRSRKLLVGGAALVVSAILVFGTALLYVWLAPKTYSAHAKVSIERGSHEIAVRFEDLPLESFKQDRNLIIRTFRNTSLFEIVAFGHTPEAAARHANQRVRELADKVRSQLKAQVYLIEEAEPNPRAVRPNRKAIIAISGVSALNLAVVGVICLLVGFLKNRALSATPKMPAQTIA